MIYQQKCEDCIIGTWKPQGEGGDWLYIKYNNEAFGTGNGVTMIQFSELFQLFQQEALDKAIISAYCL